MSRLTKVFLAYVTTSSGRVASHSKEPLWFPNICYLMVSPARHSLSQWLGSCSSRWHFGQIWSWDGSRQWSYWWREGWWLDRRQASSTSSSWFLICFMFACRWIIANCFIYNLNRAGKGNWKHYLGGNGGGFFGCFVGYFVTWNKRMTRDPLNEDGRRYVVNGIVNWRGTWIWWNESFT